MEESRRALRNLLVALAGPVVVIVMIPLALFAGLAYYLAAVFQGFWGSFRDLPLGVLNLKSKPRPLREPHFLKVPAPGKPVE